MSYGSARQRLDGAVLTHDQAASLLAEYLGAADTELTPSDKAECRRVIAAAIAGDPDLPTSWYDVWDRVEGLEAQGEAAGGYDFQPVYRLLNVAVNTSGVLFPRDVG